MSVHVSSAAVPPMSGEPLAPGTDQRATVALWAGVIVLLLVYGGLFAAGIRFFVLKTAVLPVFLLYALMLSRRFAFVVDWLPLVTATLLFDALRGAIYVAIQHGYHTYQVDYVIAFEQAIFGVSAAPFVLQPLRTPMLDAAAVAVHASHFAFFLIFGLVLWHTRRTQFPLFSRALVWVMMLGLGGYVLVPTAPPWLASNLGVLPSLEHVSQLLYTMALPDLHRTFDTNPVAAMPSLHTAFPVICAWVAWHAYGRGAGTVLTAYAILVGLVVVYLGEHYAVDVVAGVAVAALAVWLATRVPLSMEPRASLAVSGLGFGMTVGLIGFLH